MQELENGESSIGECLKEVTALLSPLQCGSLSDWNGIITDKKGRIEKLNGELSVWDTALEEAEKKLQEVTRMRSSLLEEYRVFFENFKVKSDGYDAELERMDKDITALTGRITELGKQRATLTSAIENLKNKLAGTIVCPACRHPFILSDENFDVQAARKQVEDNETEKGKLDNLLTDCRKQSESIEESEKDIRTSKRALAGQNTAWEEKLRQSEKSGREALGMQEDASQGKERILRSINAMQTELDGIRRKLLTRRSHSWTTLTETSSGRATTGRKTSKRRRAPFWCWKIR